MGSVALRLPIALRSLIPGSHGLIFLALGIGVIAGINLLRRSHLNTMVLAIAIGVTLAALTLGHGGPGPGSSGSLSR